MIRLNIQEIIYLNITLIIILVIVQCFNSNEIVFLQTIILLYNFIILGILVGFYRFLPYFLLILYFFFFIMLYKLNLSLINTNNIYFNMVIAIFVAMLYIEILYYSGDGFLLQELVRILIAIIVIFFFSLGEKVTLLTILLSMGLLFWYTILGRIVLAKLLYKILKLPETDSPVYIINRVIVFVFYYGIYFIYYLRKIKLKFSRNIIFISVIRGLIWFFIYILGSLNFFLFMNLILNVLLLLHVILEFFITNYSFLNKISSGLTKKNNNNLINKLLFLKEYNPILEKLYINLSINYLAGQQIDMNLASVYKRSFQDIAEKTLENSYFFKFLEETLETGENRYFTKEWYPAEDLACDRAIQDNIVAEDNYTVRYLLENAKVRKEILCMYSDKEINSKSLVRVNSDGLILKGPSWYINLSLNLV